MTYDLGYQPAGQISETERAVAAPCSAAVQHRLHRLREEGAACGRSRCGSGSGGTGWSISPSCCAPQLPHRLFFFQDCLVRRPVLYQRVRIGFLVFTLVWLGWYAKAQLSVVNILTFVDALRTGFQLGLLPDGPAGLYPVVLGRGIDPVLGARRFLRLAVPVRRAAGTFELASAKALHLPKSRCRSGASTPVADQVHDLFSCSACRSTRSLGAEAAEVEPFKTAIILHFARDWWFVLFAVAVLAAGLFIERFFCRYLCPLGAALAIPGRMRMFDWLRRYQECGNPCQRCGNECPVQAIHPEGHINPNECIQCMHCQVLYHHDQKCPVMIQRRLKREKRPPASSPACAGANRTSARSEIARRQHRLTGIGCRTGRKGGRPCPKRMIGDKPPRPAGNRRNCRRQPALCTVGGVTAAGQWPPAQAQTRPAGGQQRRGEARRPRRILRALTAAASPAKCASSGCPRCAS